MRGGVGGYLPYENATREPVIANFAPGYYFTDHDMAPFGDLVGYVSTNLNQLTDNTEAGNTVPNNTTVTITPGFRDHLGANWYLLGGAGALDDRRRGVSGDHRFAQLRPRLGRSGRSRAVRTE